MARHAIHYRPEVTMPTFLLAWGVSAAVVGLLLWRATRRPRYSPPLIRRVTPAEVQAAGLRVWADLQRDIPGLPDLPPDVELAQQLTRHWSGQTPVNPVGDRVHLCIPEQPVEDAARAYLSLIGHAPKAVR